MHILASQKHWWKQNKMFSQGILLGPSYAFIHPFLPVLASLTVLLWMPPAPYTASAQHPVPEMTNFSILRRTRMFLFLPLSLVHLTIRLTLYSLDTQNPQNTVTLYYSCTLCKEQSSPWAPCCLTHLPALDFHSHLKQVDREHWCTITRRVG